MSATALAQMRVHCSESKCAPPIQAHLSEDHEKQHGKAAAVRYHAHVQVASRNGCPVPPGFKFGDERQILRPWLRMPRRRGHVRILTQSFSVRGREKGLWVKELQAVR